MKHIILTLCLLGLIGCTRSVVVISPDIEANHSLGTLHIDRIELYPETTRLGISVYNRPGGKFKISKKSYLLGRTSGKKYTVQDAEGIPLNKNVTSDSTGVTSFTLTFEPTLPEDRIFDFVESDEWQILGINTTGDRRPAEIVCRIEGRVINRPKSRAIILNTHDKVSARHETGNIVIPILRDGRFVYELRTNECDCYGLLFNDEVYGGMWWEKQFFAENGTLHITLTGESGIEVEGGEINTEYHRLINKLKGFLLPTNLERDSLDNALLFYSPEFYTLAMDSTLSPEKLSQSLNELKRIDRYYSEAGKELTERHKKAVAECKKWLYTEMESSPSFPLYAKLYDEFFHHSIRNQPFPEKLVNLYREKYKPLYPSHPFTREIEHMVNAQELKQGGEYIDITLPDAEGSDRKLSELIAGNKVTLLDFWASYCGPCRRQSKRMIPVYEQYKDKGFGIVGISRDNLKSMKKTATKDGYPWINLSDNESNIAFKKYGLDNAAGGTFLLDADGHVILVNGKIDEIIHLIKDHCGK